MKHFGQTRDLSLENSRLESESPKGRVEKIGIFCEIFDTKHFPKMTKTLKNLFGFDQHMLVYVHHI